MIATEAPPRVAEGVMRLGSPRINWYLVEDDDGVTVVDAGAPKHQDQLAPALRDVGRDVGDVRAVILTHGDGDHKGFAERLRRDHGVPVHVHGADEQLTRRGKPRAREASLLPYLRRPAALKIIADLIRGGMPIHVGEVETFGDGEVLEVPGRPRVIHAPGHTPGCVAFHFERHGVLITGDVLVTYNVLTGRRGPQIMPAGFNTSSEQALASLSAIEGIEDVVLLPGHGEPWTEGARAAVRAARAAGPS